MQTFPKTHRLLTKREFDVALDRGVKVVCPEFVLFGLKAQGQQPQSAPPARLGLIVSRKVGNAVVRNRVKRAVREHFRTLGDEGRSELRLSATDVVVIARAQAADLKRQNLSVAFSKCLQRLSRRLVETNRPAPASSPAKEFR